MQGLWFPKDIVDKWPDSLLADLAGNAFTAPVCEVVLLAGLAALATCAKQAEHVREEPSSSSRQAENALSSLVELILNGFDE